MKKTRSTLWLAAALAWVALPGSVWNVVGSPPICDRTYTLDADFDEGTLLNVNHTVVTDQLQLNTTTTPFPFVNIACSARGTAVRIDVNTGAILGEYQTAPDGMGMDPSPPRWTSSAMSGWPIGPSSVFPTDNARVR